MAIWETPIVVRFFPKCEEIVSTFRLQRPAVRSGLYFLLAIFLFHGRASFVVVGLAFLAGFYSQFICLHQPRL